MLDFNYDSFAEELELRNRELQLPLGSRTTPWAGSKGYLLGASGKGVVRSITDFFTLAGKGDSNTGQGSTGRCPWHAGPTTTAFPRKSKGQVRSGH